MAVSSLQEYLEEPLTSKRDLAGVVFGFVMAFELAWKCLQDRIDQMGYAERGPKPVLTASLRAGLIRSDDEEVWSQMLRDRNLASHTYAEAVAREVVDRISATHLAALQSVVARLISADDAEPSHNPHTHE